MADWNWEAIKTEYITNSKTSFRKLADKYGLHKDTIWKKAKDERWDELRRQHIDNTQTKILEADTEQKVDRATKLQTVADKVLNMVEAYIEASDPTAIDTQSMKHISGVLKDIKEVQRTSKDLEEQDARIAKLRREAEKEDDQQRDVTITIEGGDPSWQA